MDLSVLRLKGNKMEKWKTIKGYSGDYEVSDTGRIRSFKQYYEGGKILKPNVVTGGYYAVVLCKGGKNKKIKIHRLVATHFIDNLFNKPCINHINGVKEDNRASNLEWCTRSENDKHAFRLGLRTQKGEQNSCSKLTDKKVREIKRLLLKKKKLKVLAERFEVSVSCINNIKRGRDWKHVMVRSKIERR